MNQTFVEPLTDTINRIYEKSVDFIPGLVAALFITLLGLLIALLLRVVIRRVLASANFDSYFERLGATTLLAKADIGGPPSRIAAKVVFWFVFLIFLMTGVSALGSELWRNLVSEFFLYIPKLISASAILLIGYVVGNFLSRAALLAAVNADLPSPRILALGVKLLLALLAFSMALDQLGIARGIVTSAFSIAFGAIMLALALAFGLGGRDAAKKILEARLERKEKPDQDPFSHL